MVSFIPSSIQKRLIRYALSRLELLDTDALDLENLDVTWGKRSTVEIKDVEIRVERLSSLLQLPPSLQISSARIVQLRLTVPADIYSSGINIDIEGVKIWVRALREDVRSAKRHSSSTRDSRSLRSPYSPYDPGGVRPVVQRHGRDEDAGLPTAEDLAKSFLETEPADERRHLAAAAATQYQVLQQSISSEGCETDIAYGTGTNLSLPAFLATFLDGILGRLGLNITNVTFNLSIDLCDSVRKLPTASAELETATVTLTVGEVEVGGVQFRQQEVQNMPPGNLSAGEQRADGSHTGRRRVILRKIRADISAASSVFSNLSRTSDTVSNPRSAPDDGMRPDYGFPINFSPGQNPNASSPTHQKVGTAFMSMETTSENSDLSPSFQASLSTHALHASNFTDDGGKFADAPVPAAQENIGTLAAAAREELLKLSNTQTEAGLDKSIDGRDRLGSLLRTGPWDAESGSSREHDPPFASTEWDSATVSEGKFRTSSGSGSTTATTRENVRQRLVLASDTSPEEFPSRRSTDTVAQPLGSGIHSLHSPHLGHSAEHLSADNMERVFAPTEIPDLHRDSSIESSSSTGTPSPTAVEDLTQSRMFSHEEAETMYMSAFSKRSDSNSSLAFPGRWEASSTLSTSGQHRRPLGTPKPMWFSQPGNFSRRTLPKVGQSATAVQECQCPGNSASGVDGIEQHTLNVLENPPTLCTDREDSAIFSHSSSPKAPSDKLPLNSPKIAKKVFEVDEILLFLPVSGNQAAAEGQMRPGSGMGSELEETSMEAEIPTFHQIPGAWSDPAKARQNHDRLSSIVSGDTSDPPAATGNRRVLNASPSYAKVEGSHVAVGSFTAQLDLSTSRLITEIIQQLVPGLENSERVNKETGARAKEASFHRRTFHAWEIHNFSLAFLEHLPGTVGIVPLNEPNTDCPTSGQTPLLALSLRGVNVACDLDEELFHMKTTLRCFRVDLSGSSLLRFDDEPTMKASTREVKDLQDKDVSLSFMRTKTVTQTSIYTRPIQIYMDLQSLDDALSCIGGFSSILELGSSIASSSTITSQPPKKKRQRAVRFEGFPETTPLEPSSPTFKFESRLAAANVRIQGQKCNLTLRTSAIKVIGRPQGVGVGISEIELSGPHSGAKGKTAPVSVHLSSLKAEYAVTPKEADLDQLLSLLTPSKDKYDSDDDILLGTLIRQRRNGPVFKVGIKTALIGVEHREELLLFQPLSEEIARLSTVAKYLPEDDRPGILTIANVEELVLKATTRSPARTLVLACYDLSCAHVGLPSLMALGIEKISLNWNEREKLICEVLPQEPANQLPMVMARIVGDDIEPTLKVKLWNICLEYNVETLMTLLALSSELAVDLARSAFNGAMSTNPPSLSKQSSGISDRSGTSLKPLRLDVLLRDCAIGLTPKDLPSKGLFVLTSANLAGSLPGKTKFSSTLEVQKASMLIIDDVANFATVHTGPQGRPGTAAISSSQVTGLCGKGYVSVSSISAAKVALKVFRSADGQDQLLDIQLADELFVLETCADSTQTLIGILNGLKLPTPPSNEAKYRTAIISVQDMLASLTSEPVGKGDTHGNVELDFETLHEPDNESGTEPDSSEPDYLTNFDHAQIESGSDSIREDTIQEAFDGFPSSSPSIQCPDQFEGFQEEGADQAPLSMQESYFGTASDSTGGLPRWDSAKNAYGRTDGNKAQESPLKVRVRDVHVIWNLFDGYDWQKTRDTISKAVKNLEIRAEERRLEKRHSKSPVDDEEESVIGDFLFNSIYIGIPANHEPRELSRQINRDIDDLASEASSLTVKAASRSPSRQGGSRTRSKRLRLERSKHRKISFELTQLSADLVVFPTGSGETQSSIDVRVNNFEIFDLVPTSTWKKFMTYMQDAGEREMGRPMFHLELLNVRPVADLAASEIVLRVSVLPLRLHVDQDALDFITRFFEFKDQSSTSQSPKSEEAFLQRVEVNAIPIKLDYKPKKVDYAGIRSGHTNEFKNFFILDGADLVLRHVIVYGVLGFDKLHTTLNDIWTPDVLRNQLPGVLAGLGPMRSLVDVAGGLRDLVVIPLGEYRKDGRIGRSISKGALRFARITGGELARLGTKIAIGTQNILQGAENFLLETQQREDGGWEDSDLEEEEKKIFSLYADQPVGVVQGLKRAARGLQHDLLTARDAIVAIPGEIMESGSAVGAGKAVLRRAPTIILRPGIGATKAIGQTLMGATNALDPLNRRRIEDKYKRH